MYFHGEVEVREWVGAIRRVPFEELAFFFRKGLMIFLSPGVEEALDSVFLCVDRGRREVLICVGIREVVSKGKFDVLVAFDD